ncbi:MAG TPA: hypothetical protein VLH15_07455 [Dehalococcoidales bacterium]|nr:hypothetical protein [Dehalococcoidales bacterium]
MNIQMDGLIPSEAGALAAWANLVRQNRRQAERFREMPEVADYYAPTASSFKVGTLDQSDAVLEFLKTILKPEDIFLDIGAGGGRYALPIAPYVSQVIALEPSAEMRSNLFTGISNCEIRNIQVMEERWPMAGAPPADVCFISHVGYDIEDIGPFLAAMESSARRICIAVLRDSSPASSAAPFWPLIHGEPRLPLPSLKDFLVLLLARRRLFEVKLISRDTHRPRPRELLTAFLRQQLFLEPGSEKDQRLQQLIEIHWQKQTRGYQPEAKPDMTGIVTWKPR